jgi:hypothetical protein
MLERELGWPVLDFERQVYAKSVTTCAERDQVAFTAAYECGRQMRPEQAVGYALDE